MNRALHVKKITRLSSPLLHHSPYHHSSYHSPFLSSHHSYRPIAPLFIRHYSVQHQVNTPLNNSAQHQVNTPPNSTPLNSYNTNNTNNNNNYNNNNNQNSQNNANNNGKGRSKYRIPLIITGSLASVVVGGSLIFFYISPYTPKEFYQQFFRSIRSFWVFALITLDYKYSLYGLEYGSLIYRDTRSKVHKRAAERMLWLANANKGIFIKAGQHLASLTHLLPIQYTDTLCVLQDKAPYVTFDEVVDVFVQEFGCHPDAIFESFERRPIASASLAQVHRAKLATVEGKKDVAVKIQYPGLIEKFSGDVKTFQIIAKLLSIAFPDFQFGWLVDEFKHSVAMELDFENEARNAERIARNFSWRKQFAVPKIHWAYTKKRILTMEFIEGIKITDANALKQAGYNLQEVAYHLVDLFSEQVFVHGFVHSDPHPGNILVRKTKGKWGKVAPEIVLLDHGLYRKLDEDVRLNYCKLWRGLVVGSEADVENYGRKLGAGDYCKYLAMMLTFRPKIGRLDQAVKIERDEIKKLATELWESGVIEEISSLLESLPRDLLLVLRTNDLIMSINKELGFPVNRFMVMARAAIRGIVVSEETSRRVLERLRYSYSLFVFNLKLRLVSVIIRMYKLYRSVIPNKIKD